MARADDRLDVARDLLAEEGASLATIEWPGYTADPDGFGQVKTGTPTSRQVPCFANTLFDRLGVGTLQTQGASSPGGGGPGADSASVELFMAALDKDLQPLPAEITTACRVTLADGTRLRITEPRPFPGDGDPIFYKSMASAGT